MVSPNIEGIMQETTVITHHQRRCNAADYIFFKSRSGVSNKEKSARVADFFLCVWSSLAASHHAHFDTAAFLQKKKKCLQSSITPSAERSFRERFQKHQSNTDIIHCKTLRILKNRCIIYSSIDRHLLYQETLTYLLYYCILVSSVWYYFSPFLRLPKKN